MSSLPPHRRPDIDFLRILATYTLFVFHSAMVFAPFPFYHVANAERSEALGILAGFIAQWHMPLFFLLAGWSVLHSLSRRSARGFYRERVRRLFVPLVFGCLVLMPPIKYIELRGGQNLNFHGLGHLENYDQAFLDFLPGFFTRLEYFSWGHLWFIAYLFTFSLLYGPFFSRALGKIGSALRPAGRAASSIFIYLPILPLALIQITLRPHWPGLQNLINDWANFAYYSLYFILGFVLALSPRIEEMISKEWRRAGFIALASLGVLWYAAVELQEHQGFILGMTALAGWCCVLTLLGVARAKITTAGRTLQFLSETAFPVYLLHQSAIVLLGSLIVKTSPGIGAKYALLVAASVMATLVLVRFVIRPVPVLRLLTGMKSITPVDQPADRPEIFYPEKETRWASTTSTSSRRSWTSSAG